MSAATQARPRQPSPRHRHVIRMSQRLSSPICDRPGKPETDPDLVFVEFDLRPVDFDFLR